MRNPLKKWYRWKYSGMITVPVVVILAIGLVYFQQSELEFFDSWNCDLLIDYRDKNMITSDYPTYLELSDEQKEYYNSLIENDCMFNP